MTKDATLTEQHQRLTTALDDAALAASEAFDRALRKRTEAPAEAIAPLIDFDNAIRFKRPDATPEAERADRQRELTDELFATVKERGLVFKVVRSEEGWGLGLTDPNVDADLEATRAKKATAEQAIREFDRNHGEELKAEQRVAEAAAIRETIAGDDPDAIREAINGPPADALTSSDFAPSRVTTAG